MLKGLAEGPIQDHCIEITLELLVAFRTSCTDLGTFSYFGSGSFALPFCHLGGNGFC